MRAIHKKILEHRWADLSFAEKMGNIGSEVSRARSADERNDIERRNKSLDRVSELVDITLASENKDARVREIKLLRSIVKDIKSGLKDIHLKSIEQYCVPFAVLARNNI
ncbi:MAG: hypothetical protein CO042_02100 [Parcubacteria group bacterium CG_4_9_14_0_2_um_filter_41_8]|nr:MAG: hypothetical protein COV79_01760 [Parcubacteria group bacterium CG11_big_fil_rev_8_21_14_0_20_41_14]PIR56621.1 MAG: hypothetical protein COU72_05270 [Parcubacteria group bacterium CG10_big_fil_rev_8_21_14_0_10_41_35]PIZ81863.1 MAG: hypothetical protein COY02_00945 [Parcubacteria group bacterium CG_4_10_14_0_2_um_filter_41_6]PJC40758.1 MAG: hypothetical protein CO042_02100 [Parcubacteria group bacterium CG_4_9_14_0_2_um_filter_41_8]